MTTLGLPVGMQHAIVLSVLVGCWYFFVLRKPSSRRRTWYRSRIRTSLAICTLPVLISVFLGYLALMDSPFISSRKGREFFNLTLLLWLLCLGIAVKQWFSLPSPLLQSLRKTFPQRLEVGYARRRIWLLLVVVSGVTLWSLFLMGIGLFSGHIVLVLSAALGLIPWALFLLPAVWTLVCALRHHGPVVIFDERGIMDCRLCPDFVAWSDVGMITLGYQSTYYKLRVAFSKSVAARPYVGRPYYPRKLLNMLVGLGDWNVGLGLLDVRREDALAIARHYQRQARRSRPVHQRQTG